MENTLTLDKNHSAMPNIPNMRTGHRHNCEDIREEGKSRKTYESEGDPIRFLTVFILRFSGLFPVSGYVDMIFAFYHFLKFYIPGEEQVWTPRTLAPPFNE